MTEQAKPFKRIQNPIETLGGPAETLVRPEPAVIETEAGRRPPSDEPRLQRSVLDNLLAAGWLNWELVAWLVVIALAVLTRMWDLAPRAMHHDESIHGKFSYDMFKGVSIYRYDPTWHGPVLYYMVSLSYFLLGGATEFSARFSPALFGIGLIAICYFLRPVIGQVGALAFAILMLVSPSVLYYSRSLRHDIYATFGMLLFIIGLFRYAQARPGRKVWWMALAGIGFFVLFGSHEMSFLNLATLLTWLGFVFLFELVVMPRWVRARHSDAPTLPETVQATPASAPEVRPAGRAAHKPKARRLNPDAGDDDDELDDPLIEPAFEPALEQGQPPAHPRLAASPSLSPTRSATTRPTSAAIPDRLEDYVRPGATGYRDPLPGRTRWLHPVLFAVLALTVVIGAYHLFVDKTPDGNLQQLFGLPAFALLIPFFLLLAWPVSGVLALLVDYAYRRLSPASFKIARLSGLVIFGALAVALTLLYLRGRSPLPFLTALNLKLSGTATPALNHTADQGYQQFSEIGYLGLQWPSIVPQLVVAGIAALLLGGLAGWLWERGLLFYTSKGLYGFGVAAFFVTVLSTLVSLRFLMVSGQPLPKVKLPLLGVVDKWLAYMLGGFVLALVIGLVAGWFVSMAERLSDDDLRGSAVLRAVLKFARQPRAVVALLLGFGILYVLIFSNFFFAPERLADGFYRGIEYWGEQHGKRRLDQPWFYYPMLMLLYETFAVVFTFAALVYFPVSWWRRTARRERFIFTVRGVFIGLTFWWSFCSLVMYSIAGEKIPWLNMQIAVPFSLATAAFLNDYLRRVEWRRLFSLREGLLFAGIFTLCLAAVLALAGMLINFPKREVFNAGFGRNPTDSDIRLALVQIGLVGAVALGLFGFSLWLWATNRLDGRIARAAVALVLGLILFGYCVKSTIALNYDHPDTAVEPMIYTQTTPEVPLFMQRLGRLARDLRDTYKIVPAQPQPGQLPAIYPDPANSKGIPLYVSSEVAWPLSWYLRDYTNVNYGTITNDPNNPNVIDRLTDPRGNNYVMILVSAGENTTRLQEQLQGQYTAHQYRFRWHFPEDDTAYGGLGYQPPDDYRESRIATKDIINTRWDLFYRSFTEQPFAGRLWRYLMYRELWQPLQSFDMVAYVRNDINPDFALTGAAPGAGAPSGAAGQNAVFDLTASSQPGNRNGQYRTPRNVAIAPNGEILVLDSMNGRVQRFDPEGKFIDKFGTIGTADGQFNLAQFESGPGGLTTDQDGNIYVTDTWSYRIQKFDKNGQFLLKWGSGFDSKGDLEQNRQNPGGFYGPRSITYDRSAGELFITDTGNRRIVVYDRDGRFVRQFGSKGSGPGQFDEPVSVALGPDGLVYVADLRNRRIQLLDKQGNYQGEYAVPSWKEAPLNEPYLAFDPQGTLYATDPANGAVLQFDKSGAIVKTHTSPNGIPLVNPVGLTFDPQGNLYIADARRNAIVKTRLP